MDDERYQLLTSDAYVRRQTSLSDNMAGENLLPAIRRAQDIDLRTILGTPLLERLQHILADKALNEEANTWYRRLLDEYVQPFLACRTIQRIIPEVAVKIANIGVVQTTDEHVQHISRADLSAVAGRYEKDGDWYAMEMQLFLIRNFSHFPELTEARRLEISSHLDNAASSGVFLGGARGKGGPYRRGLFGHDPYYRP